MHTNAAQYEALHAVANEAALHVAGTKPTVIPGAPSLESQLRGSLKALTDARAAELAAKVGCSVEQVREVHAFAARESDVVALKPARELVAIGALVWHEGPCCDRCDGVGHDGAERERNVVDCQVPQPCCKCGVEEYGEIVSRGVRCGGVFGESCAAGIYAEQLADGAFELPSGALVCRSCAAVAVGYRGLDDAIDLGILTALELAERGAL